MTYYNKHQGGGRKASAAFFYVMLFFTLLQAFSTNVLLAHKDKVMRTGNSTRNNPEKETPSGIAQQKKIQLMWVGLGVLVALWFGKLALSQARTENNKQSSPDDTHFNNPSQLGSNKPESTAELLKEAKKVVAKEIVGKCQKLKKKQLFNLFSQKEDSSNFNKLLKQINPGERDDVYFYLSPWNISEKLTREQMIELGVLIDTLAGPLAKREQEEPKRRKRARELIGGQAYKNVCWMKRNKLEDLLLPQDKAVFTMLINKCREGDFNNLLFLNIESITDSLTLAEVDQLALLVTTMADNAVEREERLEKASVLLQKPALARLQNETGTKLVALLTTAEKDNFIKLLEKMRIDKEKLFVVDAQSIANTLKGPGDIEAFSYLIDVVDKSLEASKKGIAQEAYINKIKYLLEESSAWKQVKTLTNDKILELLENEQNKSDLKAIISACGEKELASLDVNSVAEILQSKDVSFLIAIAETVKKKTITEIILTQDGSECSVCLDEYIDGCEIFSSCGNMVHHFCKTCLPKCQEKCPFNCKAMSLIKMKFIKNSNTLRRIEGHQ